ncbi:MAG TPA: hypothetical protein VK642_01075 [Burkholderiales bacterium]|nr:hypothetical protein [Burkholderiales bacterium]
MRKIIPQISFIVLLLSVLIYVAGRWAIRNPISDDAGDWLLWSGSISALALLFSIVRGLPLSFRRGVNIGAICTIIFLAAVGTWGLFSTEGQKQFPEMAGLVPYYALMLAGILVLLLGITNLIWSKGGRR